MNAKEYLMQVGMIDAKLKIIDANISRIRKELKGIGDISVTSSWPDGQPHGTKTTDPTGRKATKLADMYSIRRDALIKSLTELEYDQIMTRSQLWKKRMEVLEKIQEVYIPADAMSSVYFRLLTMRYIEGSSFETIAEDIGYTWRHTIRLHEEALARMEAILNE